MTEEAARLGDDVLQNWKVIGHGGFGTVYQAWQNVWHYDVAVKMLFTNDGNELWREAKSMTQASSPYVLRVFGMYEGCPPGMKTGQRLGIVTELMKMGSVESLQERLSGRAPWPLVFRLAHEVALGMNFLHRMTPPLLHQDLKPSNVLLDDEFHAKLADFGLSRVTNSVLKSSGDTAGQLGGTLAYTPPEAIEQHLHYKPVRAYDIYSFAVLLWSILTGEKPYSSCRQDSLVALHVPRGARPPSHDIDSSQADGLPDLVALMERCWDGEPERRPSFGDCLKVTGDVFSNHKNAIRNAVDQVLSKMDAVDGMMSHREKAKFVDDRKADLIQHVSMAMAITEDLGEMVHPEIYSRIEAKTTSQEKIRLLYSTVLRSGGVKVKAAFYDGLEQHERNLLQSLSEGFE